MIPAHMTNDYLQDQFLESLREAKILIAIYLTNGIKLQGRIDSFDPNVIIIKNDNSTSQMIYKHAISTIMPAAATARYNDRTVTVGRKGKSAEDALSVNAA